MAQSSTKKVAKKAVAKKAATKKTAVKKKAPAAKKTATKKAAAKKAPSAKKVEIADAAESAEPKVAAKKAATKKTPAKKAAAKKPAAKKSAAKKAAAKPTAKKAAAKKADAKPAAAKKKVAADETEVDTDAEALEAESTAASKKTASKKKATAKKSDAESKSSAPAGPKITVGELEVPDHTKAQRDSSGHYMSQDELNHFSEKLADWKQALMEEVDRTVGHMKDDATNFPDPNDRATQEEEFSLELRTRDRERKLIKKINEAQKRIDDLEYGYCETCGVEIGVGRLEARPTAELCIDCKTLEEVRERQNA